jgi:hypothetical protein
MLVVLRKLENITGITSTFNVPEIGLGMAEEPTAGNLATQGKKTPFRELVATRPLES